MGRPETIYLCRVFFTVGGFLLAALSPTARRRAPLPAHRGLPCSSPCRSAPGERGGRARVGQGCAVAGGGEVAGPGKGGAVAGRVRPLRTDKRGHGTYRVQPQE